MTKRRGKKMEGLGCHYSGTEKKPVTGHSLVQGLYLVLGRHCPLAPRMYRQRAVCEAEGVDFASKVDIMAEIINTFVPVAGTLTHVLLDSWYTSKRIWKIARKREFLITSGLRCNRSLRIEDDQAEKGWRWQRVDEYADALPKTAWQRVCWPNQNGQRSVYVQVASTRIKKLYRCQLVMARGQWDDDEEERTLNLSKPTSTSSVCLMAICFLTQRDHHPDGPTHHAQYATKSRQWESGTVSRKDRPPHAAPPGNRAKRCWPTGRSHPD